MSCGVPQQLIVQHLIRRAEGTGKHTVARKIILELKQRNGIDILNRLATQLSRLQGPLNPDKSDPQKAAVALKKLRHALQPNQGPIILEKENRKKRIQAAHAETKRFQEEQSAREQLSKRFIHLLQNDDAPQERGRQLERLVHDLLSLEALNPTGPFVAPGEQIDGHFKFEGFDYLLEIKWLKSPVLPKDLDSFDSKLGRKAQSTRGLFISINGFSENAVDLQNSSKRRIILMTGKELINILEGRSTFKEVFRKKVVEFVRRGVALVEVF